MRKKSTHYQSYEKPQPLHLPTYTCFKTNIRWLLQSLITALLFITGKSVKVNELFISEDDQVLQEDQVFLITLIGQNNFKTLRAIRLYNNSTHSKIQFTSMKNFLNHKPLHHIPFKLPIFAVSVLFSLLLSLFENSFQFPG